MENNELEEMKAQLAMLNKKLEKESIINEKLTKATLNSKTQILNINNYKTLILDGLGLVFGPVIFWELFEFNFPIWIGIAIIVLTTIDIIINLFLFRKLNLNEIMNENVSSSISKLKKYKKSHRRWLCIQCVIGAILLAFIYIWWAQAILSRKAFILGVSCGMILIAGGIWSVSKCQKKVYYTCDELIEQLGETEKAEYNQ